MEEDDGTTTNVEGRVIQHHRVAAAILTLQAIAINWLAGIDYPLSALRDGRR